MRLEASAQRRTISAAAAFSLPAAARAGVSNGTSQRLPRG
jgi:hypothetical protein